MKYVWAILILCHRHLKYTIPPAIVLTFLYRPFLDRLNLYKIIFLVVVAVVSTIPWDSYLIRCKIWTYPPNVILGPTLFSIPAEEGFFFVIQTYNTALLYAILSKPLFHPSYLSPSNKISGSWRKVGQLAFALGILAGMGLIWKGDKGTYLGLILVWASPFALLLWTLSAEFITSLPYTSTAVPIAIPTLYLWLVDTLALRRGTWSISSGTKLGIHVWDGLEIEEAIFFLATNSLIVLGLVAFDHALSILTAFPTLFPQMPELPSAGMLIKALLLKSSRYDLDRISGLYEAAERLQKKSRSFFLASSTFSGRLRVDLILLYIIPQQLTIYLLTILQILFLSSR
jgi:15-cis-phytoene synthase/lycopene beta-cyclase